MATKQPKKYAGMLQAFQDNDASRSGVISVDRFKQLFLKLDPTMDVNGLLDVAGQTLNFGTGQINYTQFLQWAAGESIAAKKGDAPTLGVIRLDYNYPPAPGDIDHPGSFGYDVMYRVVPGLTFETCQAGQLPYNVMKNLLEAVTDLERKGCCGVTGDCGFMMWYQQLVRLICKRPVFMSSLASLPAITCGYAKDELIAIFTANGQSLNPMKGLIRDECGVDPDESRFIICGCEDVPGFDAVAAGGKVNVAEVTPGMVKKAKDLIVKYPKLRAIFMECTELPPYSDAVRAATGLPVWDAITSCDFFVSGRVDNERFGISFQKRWDGDQEAYSFGGNLSEEQKKELVNKPAAEAKKYDASKDILKYGGTTKHAAACLGVVRLDYNYPPAPGDIDCPDTYAYDVFYRVVPGLTFDMCQSGKLTPDVEKEFVEAVQWLTAKGVAGITGDCGFMMWLQAKARQNTTVPVFMSSLAQLPAVTCSFSRNEKVAIFTANGKTLTPMRDLIRDECGVDPSDKRFVIVGCEDVPGFEAVAAGDKVDVASVTPGMVNKARKTLIQHPDVRGFLLECTELPPYSDAIRAATGMPVYDSITACNFFLSGRQDNARFGVNDWQEVWDGVQENYTFGQNLDKGDRAKLVNKTLEREHII
jgi:hypothetical protein